jgi:aspartate aminotransferase-like enzyme
VSAGYPEFGRFFLPGPTDVRREVLEAMVHPMFAHRGPEMRDMLQRMAGPLHKLFRTKRPILMSTSSATGFMEAAIRSGVRKRVLVVDGGFFGDRFAKIAERSGKEVVRLPVPLGRTVEADELDQWLTRNTLWTRWRWCTRKPARGRWLRSRSWPGWCARGRTWSSWWTR